jgi:hypothetical protein
MRRVDGVECGMVENEDVEGEQWGVRGPPFIPRGYAVEVRKRICCESHPP